MSKLTKISLLVIGGAAALLSLAVIGLLVFVDANRFKPRVEAAASALLEMEVTVDGKMGVSLFPSLQLILRDVHLRNGGVELAEVTKLRLWLELWPLLQRDVRVNEIVLTEPTFTITQNKQGNYNVERTTPSQDSPSRLTLSHLSLVDATFVYADQQSGQDFRARGCHIDVYDLRIAKDKNTDPSTEPSAVPSADQSNELTFSSELDCDEIHADGFQGFDLKIVAGKDAAELKLLPITLQVFGAQGSGSIHADFSTGTPLYRAEFSLPQFPIEAFFNTVAQQQTGEQLASGTMDFSASLSMRGKTVKEIIQSAKGNLSLRGENLVMHGTDLDQQFDEFESSQHFSLVDVGAFFYAGPLGLVLTKGHDFSAILRGSGGHTEIPTLVSEWQVENGVAKAVDVAMATRKNRVAMHGELDFNNGRYNDVTVALIDGDGCVAVQQEIHGDFGKPAVEQPNIFKSLAGPVISLLEKGRDLFPGGECDVFYDGSVAPPK